MKITSYFWYVVGVAILAVVAQFYQYESSWKLTLVCLFARWGVNPKTLPEIQNARKTATELAIWMSSPNEGITVTGKLIPVENGVSIPSRIFTPTNLVGKKDLPVVVHYHGGGFVLYGNGSHDEFCKRVAKESNYIVVTVDYRLAPEHKYPTASDDAYNALKWLSANAKSFGGDPNRFAVAGDSAGGNLAAVAALRARDDGFQPPLKAQILNYPVTNHSFDNPSHQIYDKYLLSVDKMKWYWDQYLNSPEEGLHPYASPLLAKNLSNLPPALVQIAELDILRDEGRLYAEALQKAGNDVQLSLKKGMIHGFIGMSMLAPTEVDEAYQEIVTFLKRTLN